jgi:hypothetical protein
MTLKTLTHPPTTARALASVLTPFSPGVDGRALVFDLEPHADLEPVLSVIHTGIRAMLTGQKWYGCGSDRAMAAPRPLNPDAPIPAGITLVCVEGDQRWDRIGPAARLDLLKLFGK